jgi:hypothetical protein
MMILVVLNFRLYVTLFSFENILKPLARSYSKLNSEIENDECLIENSELGQNYSNQKIFRPETLQIRNTSNQKPFKPLKYVSKILRYFKLPFWKPS